MHTCVGYILFGFQIVYGGLTPVYAVIFMTYLLTFCTKSGYAKMCHISYSVFSSIHKNVLQVQTTLSKPSKPIRNIVNMYGRRIFFYFGQLAVIAFHWLADYCDLPPARLMLHRYAFCMSHVKYPYDRCRARATTAY